MDAIVLAGGIPQPDDPLYAYTQGKPKPLLEIAGKPMLQWVLNALSASDHVDNVVIVGLDDQFVHMKDAVVCGGDMNVIRCNATVGNDEFWERAVAARKNVFKQAALVGYGTLFLMLTRQLSIEAAVRRGFKKLGFRCRTIFCPYPEIGMDVDKPYHVDILRADLEGKETG